MTSYPLDTDVGVMIEKLAGMPNELIKFRFGSFRCNNTNSQNERYT